VSFGVRVLGGVVPLGRVVGGVLLQLSSLTMCIEAVLWVCSHFRLATRSANENNVARVAGSKREMSSVFVGFCAEPVQD
jgi:hypothetical protein